MIGNLWRVFVFAFSFALVCLLIVGFTYLLSYGIQWTARLFGREVGNLFWWIAGGLESGLAKLRRKRKKRRNTRSTQDR